MAVAIGVATVVAALASTAVSYMGAEQSAQATSNAEAYNAKVQQNNPVSYTHLTLPTNREV